MAARLAACEQLIGHNFKNLDLLRQALESRGGASRRLAVLGDCVVETHLAHRWWNKKDLTGPQWNELTSSLVSNENLGNLGFRMGIDKCTLPDSCDSRATYRMATAVEALMAAVWLDTDRDPAALESVIDRFGLTHQMLDAGTARAWVYSPVTTSRTLPRYFFYGRHLALLNAFLAEPRRPGISHDKQPGRNTASEDNLPESVGSLEPLAPSGVDVNRVGAVEAGPREDHPDSEGSGTTAVEGPAEDGPSGHMQGARSPGGDPEKASDTEDYDHQRAQIQELRSRIDRLRKRQDAEFNSGRLEELNKAIAQLDELEGDEPSGHMQGAQSPGSGPEEAFDTEDHDPLKEQEPWDRTAQMRALQLRIDQLGKRQDAEFSSDRLRELNKAIAQLDALSALMGETPKATALVETGPHGVAQPSDVPTASTKKDVVVMPMQVDNHEPRPKLELYGKIGPYDGTSALTVRFVGDDHTHVGGHP